MAQRRTKALTICAADKSASVESRAWDVNFLFGSRMGTQRKATGGRPL